MSSSEILLVYRKQLGDLLLLQPTIEQLSRTWGKAVRIRTRSGFADLLSLMPGRVSLADPLRAVSCSRAYCFDTKSSTLLDAAGVWPARRILVTTRPQGGWLQRAFFHEIIAAEGRHDFRARLYFRAVGGQDFHPPRLRIPPSEWLPAGLSAGYLLVHPTSAWRRKTWSVSAWIALLQQILSRYDFQVVLTAGSETWEQEMATAIAAALPDRCLNLAGKTSLKAYMATIAHASAVLTIDGSASHLAAAFAKPALTLFGPTNPTHWHYPTPSSLHLWAAQFAKESKPETSAIPIGAVFDATIELLEHHLHA